MIFKLNKYHITYWDRYANTHTCFIKARTEEKAKQKFYKQHYKDMIVKIALI